MRTTSKTRKYKPQGDSGAGYLCPSRKSSTSSETSISSSVLGDIKKTKRRILNKPGISSHKSATITFTSILLILAIPYMTFTYPGQTFLLSCLGKNHNIHNTHAVFHNVTYTTNKGEVLKWAWTGMEPKSPIARKFFYMHPARQLGQYAVMFSPQARKDLNELHTKGFMKSIQEVGYFPYGLQMPNNKNDENGLPLEPDEIEDFMEHVFTEIGLINYLDKTAIISSLKYACPTFELGGQHPELKMIVAINSMSCKDKLKETVTPVYWVDNFGEMRGGVDKVPNAHYVNISGQLPSMENTRLWHFSRDKEFKNMMQHFLLGRNHDGLDIRNSPL